MFWKSARPKTLGPVHGRLAACPSSPNCVSTFATDPVHQIAPISCTGPVDGVLDRVVATLQQMPSAAVVTRKENYLHAEFTTRWLGFVDDVEFLYDPAAGQLHFRSASRVGRSDLGANRRRMEDFRRRFR